jgi:glycosyltransferase involved in cell wall biosynthesis
MRISIVSCVYPPEPVVSAQTSAQLAEMLTQTGHIVKVFTSFPNRPAGRLFPNHIRRFVHREWTKTGIEIIRCYGTLSPKSDMFSRLLENLSFGLTSGWQVLVSARPDIIYANTWPLMATGILFLIAKLRRIPLVISIQDVYPEALVAQMRIRENSLLARLMRWVDGIIARHSSHVIVISDHFAEIYRDQRCVPAHRLSVVPNWIDSNLIDANVSRQAFRKRKGIAENAFLLVYGGNIGVAASVETVIESMSFLSSEKHIQLLVAGAGSQLSTCQDLASAIPDKPVTFHSPWHAEETSEVLRSADLLVLPTQKEQSLASVPSKLLSYMLSGRPVLATAVPGSDLANLIESSQCGWVIEPNRPDRLAETIKEIRQLQPEELKQRGEQGRQFVLEHFSKEVCLPRVIQILENVAK